jgi:hypothetical protein
LRRGGGAFYDAQRRTDAGKGAVVPRSQGKPSRFSLPHIRLPGVRRELTRRGPPVQRPLPLYVALGVIFVVSTIATLAFPDNATLDRFGPNLSTESGGILVTLIFVQRFLEQQERTRRLRGSIGALRKGSRALTQMMEAWGLLLKGSMRRMPAPLPEAYPELFAPYITENLNNGDPSVPRTNPDGSGEPWVRSIWRQLAGAQEAISQIIVVYGATLDSQYIEVVDELADDPFVRLIGEITSQRIPDPRVWRTRLQQVRALREAHFRRLLRAIDLHNRLASDAGKVRSPDEVPRTGALGIDLSPDHDLKVHLDISPEWWRQPPSPALLRNEPEEPVRGAKNAG